MRRSRSIASALASLGTSLFALTSFAAPPPPPPPPVAPPPGPPAAATSAPAPAAKPAPVAPAAQPAPAPAAKPAPVAQPAPPPPPPEKHAHHHAKGHPFKWGGLGYAFAGPTFFSGGFMLRDALVQPDALGSSYSAPSWGGTFGGVGGLMLGRYLWVGGQGYGVFAPGSTTGRGSTHVGIGGGGFEAGFAVVNNHRWLVTPYLGLGGLGTNVEVRANSSNVKVGGKEVAAGTTATFSAGTGLFFFGIRAHKLLFHGPGGLSAALDAGGLLSFAGSGWDKDGDAVTANKTAVRGGFLRIELGGGGSWLGD
jgi:hypothetical protein